MFNLTSRYEFMHILLIQDIIDINRYILGIMKKMTKNPKIRKTETWTESKKEMLLILTRKIQKLKVDDHIHSYWVSWFSNLTIHKTLFQTNLIGYVNYCQNGRDKIRNQVSIHLFGLLLLLIFSVGLVMCLLPSSNIGNEEIVVVKAIPNSKGNFELLTLLMILSHSNL